MLLLREIFVNIFVTLFYGRNLVMNKPYNFFHNKLIIFCLLIVSKVAVKFIGRIRDVEYGHAEYVLYEYL